MEPLSPRITKSTAIAAIKARFETTEALLQRFEISKAQANLWDGERDGIREAVKTLEGGQYGHTILSWSTSAAVMYPNASGKHQLENTLQTSIPAQALEPGTQVIAFGLASTTPEEFLDAILRTLQKSKEDAINLLRTSYLGSGEIVDNSTLFEKKGADKSQITVLPEV